MKRVFFPVLLAALLLGAASPGPTRPAPSARPITKPPPATSTRPEDWTITWERFLKAWETADPKTANLFALDAPNQSAPGGKISFADALTARSALADRTQRTIRHLGSAAKPPLTMTITTYWTVKPPTGSPPVALPTLMVSEEKFDLILVSDKPYIIDYHRRDVTADERKKQEEIIKQRQDTFADKTKSPPARLNAGLPMAIAYIQILEIDKYWDTIRQMRDLGMKPYPDIQGSLVEALQRLAKDDPVPPAWQALAREIGYLPPATKPATTPATTQK